MANKYRYRRGPLDHRWIMKSGTVAVEIGDMVKVALGNVGMFNPVALSTDMTGLIGVAMSASPATDTTNSKCRIAMLNPSTVWEFGITSSTILVGDQLEIVAAQTLGERTITNLYDSGSMVVAVCAEDNNADDRTIVLCSFMTPSYSSRLLRMSKLRSSTRF